MITVYNNNITQDQLKDIPLRTPAHAGATWKGIQHGRLVDAIHNQFEKEGWNVLDQQFSVGNDGADLVGAFSLDLPKTEAPEGTKLSLGFVTSNAMKKALRFFVGASVTVCSNGITTGEIVLSRKHTVGLQLNEEIRWALEDYVMGAKRLDKITKQLRAREITAIEYEHALLEAGRSGHMPWSRIGDVDKEYRTAEHRIKHGAETSWSLLNAFTEVVKRNPVSRQMEQINGFRKLLPTNVVAA